MVFIPRFRVGRNDVRDDIDPGVIGGACIFGLESGIPVILRMRRGKIPAVKIQVVFLLAVIGQRLARHLTSRDAPAIGEDSEEERIDGSALLEDVENLLDPLIQKRNGSHLDPDHFLIRRRLRRYRTSRRKSGLTSNGRRH